MSKSKGFGIAIAIYCLAWCVGTVSAQKFDATVLYRQNSDSGYSALIPGYSNPASPDCAADVGNPACYNPTQVEQTGSTPNPVSYNVIGTTLSLLLPDGKIAVLNCINKYSSRGNYISRGCGMPRVEHVQAEFKGKSARLQWPIASEGKRTESEKYTVVAVLEKR